MVRAIGFGTLGSGTITEGGGTLVPGGVMDQDGVPVGDGAQGSTSVSAAEDQGARLRFGLVFLACEARAREAVPSSTCVRWRR